MELNNGYNSCFTLCDSKLRKEEFNVIYDTKLILTSIELYFASRNFLSMEKGKIIKLIKSLSKNFKGDG